MDETKGLASADECANIRDAYLHLLPDYYPLLWAWREAGQRVDEAAAPFLQPGSEDQVDTRETQRRQAEAAEALRKYQDIEKVYRPLKNKLDAYRNDYIIRGCPGRLEPL
ncbi:MAG: hypothetical protein ACR2PA_12340 [Hyphomicrobiaceae bacterium]